MNRRPGTTGGRPAPGGRARAARTARPGKSPAAAQAGGADRRTVPQTLQASLASYWVIMLRHFRDYVHHGGTGDGDGAP
jgi:hypothetical protein